MARLPLAVAVTTALLTGPALAEEVVVFAASSLKTALDRVAAEFQAETGNTVTISYAGSNALAKQIIAGAPADIFISASESWMDEVEKVGLVVADSRVDLWGNDLVLIAHGAGASPVTIGPGLSLPALLGDGKLSMATVASVPAGQYGKEALENLGLWEGIEGAVVQSDNVRAALALVALGEAPLGIVYASDAVAEPGVTVIGTFPTESHRAILYPAALTTEAQDAADRAFLEALRSEKADAILAAQGFTVLD